MLGEVLAYESVVNLVGVFYRRAHLRDWLIVRLIDTATGVALLSGILHPTTVGNTVTHVLHPVSHDEQIYMSHHAKYVHCRIVYSGV